MQTSLKSFASARRVANLTAMTAFSLPINSMITDMVAENDDKKSDNIGQQRNRLSGAEKMSLAYPTEVWGDPGLERSS